MKRFLVSCLAREYEETFSTYEDAHGWLILLRQDGIDSGIFEVLA